MTKISVVGPVYPYRGGIAHYTSHLANALAEKHPIEVVSFRRQYPQWLYPGQSDKDPSQQAVKVEAKYLLDPLYPWTWWNTARHIERFAPDFVIMQWWTTFWGVGLGTLAALLKRKRIPTLFIIHNVLPHEPRPWDPPLARYALGKANAFIVQTQREEVRLHDLLPKKKIVEVHPHPVYRMFSHQGLSREEAKSQLGVPVDRPILLFFGIVRPYKGLQYLIEALAKLNNRIPAAHLIIAGEFWEDKSIYLTQVERLGIQDQVTFIDRYIPNEEVPLLFTTADLFVASYVGGTQSGSVKVAMNFRLPIVISEHLVDESMLGQESPPIFCVVPRDVDGLTDALARGCQWLNDHSLVETQKPTIIDGGWKSLVEVIERTAKLMRRKITE